jgi:hypothetical protein
MLLHGLSVCFFCLLHVTARMEESSSPEGEGALYGYGSSTVVDLLESVRNFFVSITPYVHALRRPYTRCSNRIGPFDMVGHPPLVNFPSPTEYSTRSLADLPLPREREGYCTDGVRRRS